MAFKLTQTPTFKAPVTVPIANDKGDFEKNTFTGIFKRPNAKELAALFEIVISDEDLTRKYLTGWEMTDADSSEAVPFSTDNLAAFLEITTAAPAVARAFLDAVQGARAKNS